MSMQERLLQEKAKEQELKEKVRLAKEALKTAQEQSYLLSSHRSDFQQMSSIFLPQIPLLKKENL